MDCETGNPPEGWESAGQLRIEKQGVRSQESESRRIPVQGARQKVQGRVLNKV